MNMAKLQKNYIGKRDFMLPILVTKAEAALIRAAKEQGNHRSVANFIMFEVGQENAKKPAIVKREGKRKIQIGAVVTSAEAEKAYAAQDAGYFKSFSDWLVAVAARRVGGKAMEKFLVEVE